MNIQPQPISEVSSQQVLSARSCLFSLPVICNAYGVPPPSVYIPECRYHTFLPAPESSRYREDPDEEDLFRLKSPSWCLMKSRTGKDGQQHGQETLHPGAPWGEGLPAEGRQVHQMVRGKKTWWSTYKDKTNIVQFDNIVKYNTSVRLNVIF